MTGLDCNSRYNQAGAGCVLLVRYLYYLQLTGVTFQHTRSKLQSVTWFVGWLVGCFVGWGMRFEMSIWEWVVRNYYYRYWPTTSMTACCCLPSHFIVQLQPRLVGCLVFLQFLSISQSAHLPSIAIIIMTNAIVVSCLPNDYSSSPTPTVPQSLLIYLLNYLAT